MAEALVECPPRAISGRPTVVDEVRRLFSIYRLHTGAEPMAGGAQNLLKLFTSSKQRATAADCSASDVLFELPEIKVARARCRMEMLPITIRLNICGYLTPGDLCNLSATCLSWYIVANDELLWRHILQRESAYWPFITDDKNPEMFADSSYKQVYLRCRPLCDKAASVASPLSLSLPTASVLLNLITGHCPRFFMFGPGLESSSSRVVRMILTDQHLHELSDGAARRRVPQNGVYSQLAGLERNLRFTVTGMVPGETAGMGSGIRLSLADHAFTLITLYSNVRAIRQQPVGNDDNDRIQRNKLFVLQSRGTETYYQVSDNVQKLCAKTGGFVFVIDAAASIDELSHYQRELTSILCEIWSPAGAPLLVLLVSSGGEPALKPIHVVKALKLGRMKRKWMVCAGDVNSLSGVRYGFRWLCTVAGSVTRYFA